MDNKDIKQIESENEIMQDEMLPQELDTLPVQRETAEVINNIVKSDSLDELRSYTDMFRLNIAKKNALRVAKLQNLLDAVNDQAIDRVTNHPGEFSNKEIIDYMKAIQDQITVSEKRVLEDPVIDGPTIQVNNQKNEVNINVEDTGLSRESKNRVIDAVKALLQQAQAPQEPQAEEEDA